jgi:hypothetical protein
MKQESIYIPNKIISDPDSFLELWKTIMTEEGVDKESLFKKLIHETVVADEETRLSELMLSEEDRTKLRRADTAEALSWLIRFTINEDSEIDNVSSIFKIEQLPTSTKGVDVSRKIMNGTGKKQPGPQGEADVRSNYDRDDHDQKHADNEAWEEISGIKE